ncbi:hypothetical protein PoB_005291600 [Plakobranchus ocellatus]|uniref:C-type lectin domain-containing protein n=1 Tax=Plakobranchus ocellatus TaxID=259542 RepID=A0AAV4BT90_9GAST|nr:hypothetical protein PoB_005291600 [Plakobranchus ocellatus]
MLKLMKALLDYYYIDAAWIGLHKTDKGRWQWLDEGKTPTYTKWGRYLESENCATVKERNGEAFWDTSSCIDTTEPYICEKPLHPDCHEQGVTTKHGEQKTISFSCGNPYTCINGVLRPSSYRKQ